MNRPVRNKNLEGKSARLTLRDLARHADVSPATVSLVLRKSPLVAEGTRARVLESMRTLGYVYNRGAASLRTQRTHTVGVAINELHNPYFAELTAAIERAFTRIGHSVFLSNSAEDPTHQDRFIDTMREYNADGLIICPAEGTTPGIAAAHRRSRRALRADFALREGRVARFRRQRSLQGDLSRDRAHDLARTSPTSR